eukprot:8698957-Alexandrium_andersonii.AAC.1
MQPPTSLAAWTPARASQSTADSLAMMQPLTSPAAGAPARASQSTLTPRTAVSCGTARPIISSERH